MNRLRGFTGSVCLSQLQVIILSDFELDIPTTQLKASDITIEVTSKFELFIHAVQQAAAQLQEEGKKLTQTAISKLTGYSQQYLSRHWELLLSLLNTKHSSGGNSKTPSVAAEMIEIVESVATASTGDTLLTAVDDIFYHWLNPAQWGEVWHRLSKSAQTNVLSALFLTVPISRLEQLGTIGV